MTLIFTIAYYLLITICDLIWKSSTEQTPLQRKIIKAGGNFCARAILFLAGFYWISHKKARIADYLPEYRTSNREIRPPFVISNHYSWLDIYYFISSRFCPSFLSKKEVANYPLIGRIAVGLQSVFVAREMRDEKNHIIDLIEQRAKQIRANKNYPPVMIFPEGTTTNGKYLISFKKGAFFTLDPIQIVCLKYEERSFALSYDCIGDIYCFVFVFCQFVNRLTVTEFDVFDPEYLGLTKEKDWVVYMAKVKEVMRKCLGVRNSEAGFNEKKIFYQELREKMKESNAQFKTT
jgi:lysophosphatidylcholine acyltransferase/lyso-PAF acetyltransferase